MSKQIFISLPVADVARSTAFYAAIGCEKNAQFSNDRASSMVWSDAITFNLLDHDLYATLTTRPIADTHATSGALFALQLASRADVDAITEAALAAGGKEAHGPEDEGFMYSRAFWDPDGHAFGPMWMDLDVFKTAPQPDTAAA
ncbi:VOC family protein [uncultured Sphingomonas sp.]|uniref:VOC family protein n=1 Tax=uncultured Sphingomonas sp. TaxID=158754 RepID=UPI0035C9CFBB